MNAGGAMTAVSPPRLDPGQGLRERLVTLPDGRMLRAVTGGSGDPLVVFEAGLGAAAGSWLPVQRLVSAHVRTASYDRAGYGGSDPDPDARSLARMSDDLAAMLDACDETKPVVLVGHSLGGPILRAFAARQPHRVAGLCLVDATVAEAMNPRVARATVAVVYGLLDVLAKVGLSGGLAKLVVPTLPGEISPEDQQVMLREATAARSRKALRQEARQLTRMQAELRTLQDAGLPDAPTVCLIGQRAERGGKKQRQVINDATTREMQVRANGEAIVVPEAGHMIPQEQPAATAQAILALVGRNTAQQEGAGHGKRT